MPADLYLEKDKIILDYLKVHYPINLSYEVGLNGKHVSKIWVFWYQGENQMPHMVDCKFNPNAVRTNLQSTIRLKVNSYDWPLYLQI